MKISYDKEADAMYIKFRNNKFAKNKEIMEGVILDLDSKGELIGIEILEVSSRYSLKELSHLDIDMALAK